MSPAKFFCMLDYRENQQQKEDYRAGITASVILAALGDKETTALSLFPWNREKKTSTKKSFRNSLKSLAEYQKSIKQGGKT